MTNFNSESISLPSPAGLVTAINGCLFANNQGTSQNTTVLSSADIAKALNSNTRENSRAISFARVRKPLL